jgi:hypothetical protein
VLTTVKPMTTCSHTADRVTDLMTRLRMGSRRQAHTMFMMVRPLLSHCPRLCWGHASTKLWQMASDNSEQSSAVWVNEALLLPPRE